MTTLEHAMQDLAKIRGERIKAGVGLSTWIVCDSEFSGEGHTWREAVGAYAHNVIVGLQAHNERQLKRIGKRAMNAAALQPFAAMLGLGGDAGAENEYQPQ